MDRSEHPDRRRILGWATWLPVGALGAASSRFGPSDAMAADQGNGRVILVTGSTSGLGRRLAERLAAPGTTILVHGRNRARAEETITAVRRAGGEARFYGADFASLAEVNDLAQAILRENKQLNILINNAGIFKGEPPTRQTSADGHEMRFAINYLAPVRLTRLLLPLMKASTPARVVNIASSAQTSIDFDDPMLVAGYNHQRAYGQSKLALVMFTFDLATELKGSGVVVNAIHPANYMDTPMVRDAGIQPWASVEDGASAVLRLIEDPTLRGYSGSYFNGTQEARAVPQAYDVRARARLRTITEELTRDR